MTAYYFKKKPNESVKEYWWRRDENSAQPAYHRISLFLMCVLRLGVFPKLLFEKHILIQLAVYVLLEVYCRAHELEDYIPFTLNLWHGDHVGRVIQLAALCCVLFFVHHVELPLFIGVMTLQIYCWWYPRQSWIHVLSSLILQIKI